MPDRRHGTDAPTEHNGAVSHDDGPSVELAFDRAGVALSVTDTAGRLLHSNQAFGELFGWTHDDGVDISVITRPEDRDWTRTYIGRIVSGDDNEFTSVKQFVRRDGSEFSGAVTIRPLRRGDECVGIVGVVVPFQPRELVDDPRVGKLLEHSASTITLADASGNVMETAGRYRATLGYPREFWRPARSSTSSSPMTPHAWSRCATPS